jgi:YbgC/YbaW family acyl-CoA thioester hydrolase
VIVVHDRVRWSDCDPAGILYFGSYVRLYEIAETELMRACGFPYSEAGIEALGAWILRVHYSADFLAPARLDDEVDVELWIENIGRASFEQHFQVRRSSDGVLTMTGRCTTVCVDRITTRAMSIPQQLRTALEHHIR